MTQSWFRVNADGWVDGIAESSRAVAKMNLRPGQYLLPFSDTVNPRTDRHDRKARRWIAGAVALPRREDDPIEMRRTGYPEAGEQLGAVIKVVALLLSGEPVPAAVRAEFDGVLTRIQAVKAAHPKTSA